MSIAIISMIKSVFRCDLAAEKVPRTAEKACSIVTWLLFSPGG
jgi:hypothetical protein